MILAAIIAGCSLAGILFTMWAIGLVVIGDNQVGVVTKKFATKNLSDGSLVALNGEAGVQVDTLSPGWHFFFWPWQYSIEKFENLVVPKGQIALVIANDGKPVANGRRFGDTVDCNSFQDGRSFLTNGGCRGQQLTKLATGTYRINQRLFTVITQSNCGAQGLAPEMLQVQEIPAGFIGLVTVKDGLELPEGEIAATLVEGHSSFQNEQAFINANGHRGLQIEVIKSGSWLINPWFATIEKIPMTLVPVAHVGVVVSAVGTKGEDVSGDDFKNGEIVPNGCKGVWNSVLNPGQYAINTRVMKVELVNTSNAVLNWSDSKTEGHGLDKDLGTIMVQSKDGFSFPVEVQQVIHVPYDVAPKLIARFGTMSNLVQNVLEPLIGNYFRNAVQARDAKDFVNSRKERQSEAAQYITAKLHEYNVVGVDTFIGAVTPPKDLMKTLQDRKIAEESSVTISMQMELEKKRQEKERQTALADSQREVVASEQAVIIATRNAEAAAAQAAGQKNVLITQSEAKASQNKIVAESEGEALKLKSTNEADSIRMLADATAARIKAEGAAEASVIRQKTEAIGQGNYAAIEVARSLASGNLQLVPQFQMGGSGNSGPADAILSLLALSTATGKTIPELTEKPNANADKAA